LKTLIGEQKYYEKSDTGLIITKSQKQLLFASDVMYLLKEKQIIYKSELTGFIKEHNYSNNLCYKTIRKLLKLNLLGYDNFNHYYFLNKNKCYRDLKAIRDFLKFFTEE